MAAFDIQADTLPQNALKPVPDPKVQTLRSALLAYNSTSYSALRMNDMTKNDLIYASRLHGLAPTLPV